MSVRRRNPKPAAREIRLKYYQPKTGAEIHSDWSESGFHVTSIPAGRGLPMNIWALERIISKDVCGLVVASKHGKSGSIKNAVIVSVGPNPKVLFGKTLAPKDFALVRQFLINKQNQMLLRDHWWNGITSSVCIYEGMIMPGKRTRFGESKRKNEKSPEVNKGKARGIDLYNLAISDDVKAMRVALDAGANPNLRDAEGWTALHRAAYYNSNRVIKLLLKYGADPHLESKKEKMNALHCALAHGFRQCTKTMLDLGVPLKAQGKGAQHTLITASSHGDLKVVKYLLDHGVLPGNLRGKNQTALHFAALDHEKAHVEIVRLLLEAGANPRAKDWNGKTALDLIDEWSKSPPDEESAQFYKSKRAMIQQAIDKHKRRKQ